MKNFKIDLRGLSADTRQSILDHIKKLLPGNSCYGGDINRPVYFRVKEQCFTWCTEFSNADYYQPNDPWISFGELLEIEPKPTNPNREFRIDNIDEIRGICETHFKKLGYKKWSGGSFDYSFIRAYADGDFAASPRIRAPLLTIKEFFELTPEDCRV